MPLYEECRKNEKLHILLLPDRPEWAFDHITKGIMKYNPYPEKIIYSKEYIKDFPQIAYNMWDYVYIFFEGEQLIPHNKDKTIRGCYSAVWVENLAYQPKFFADKFSHCRGVIFVNDILKNAIEPLMRKNIPNTIIYDSADDALFYLIPEEKSDEFTAIFVGNVKRAVKNFPDIKNACEKTGVKLIVANNVAHDELVNEYAKAHVCSNFSTSEGGPQTFAESALCGIPMIIRDTIALSNQIPCFKVSSKEDMIKTLAYLKEHPKECEEMGKKARNTVLSKFTYKEAAKQFAEFFLSLENKQA
jgi:glycosyltransferase involved in cell wall biosynthesis